MEAPHEHWMELALVQGRANPQAPFGTVIVHLPTQRVLAAGCNRTCDSPIWHGEMDALSQMGPDAPFPECALYTTAEPCPMCQSAILWAGIPLLVYGSSIPYLKSIGWTQIDLRAHELVSRSQVEHRILSGILEEACNQTFLEARRAWPEPPQRQLSRVARASAWPG